MTYSIGEIASLFNLTTSTLRYYDKEGLLPKVERSKGGIRVFNENDYATLTIVECLKKSGMQIKDIKKFMDMVNRGDETIGERLEMFMRRRNEIIAQINELNGVLDILDYKCWYYQTALEHGTTGYVDNLKDDQLPEKIRKTRAIIHAEN